MKMGMLAFTTALMFSAAVVTAVVEEPYRETNWTVAPWVEGSMFISDAGTAEGGFEFTATYTASLTGTEEPYEWVFDGHPASLSLSLEVGLGDPLSIHGFMCVVRLGTDRATVVLDGTSVDITLVYVLSDTVWDGEFDRHYIASWGGYASEEEIRGSISPVQFGLPEHYYIELRLSMHWRSLWV